MNISSHIDELGSSPEAKAFRELTTRMRHAPEIETSADLPRRIMSRLNVHSVRSRFGADSPAFKPWFGAAAAAAVIAVVLGLRILYPTAGGSCTFSNEQWLANSQEEDGSWNPARHGGSKAYRPALTALSALALQRSGGDFADAVESACRYLVESQHPDGSFGGGGREQLYNQAIVTYMLAQSGEGGDVRSAALQRAVEFIKSRQSVAGGWDYIDNSQGSAAITAWQVQALFSAKSCGVSEADVPMRRGLRWLRGITHSTGVIVYSKRSDRSSDTISALAGYALITAGGDFPELSSLGQRVVASMTQKQLKKSSDLYRDCMKVRALKAAGKEAGAEVVRNQMAAGITDTAVDQWGMVGGRLYLASMQSLAASY